MKRIKAIPYKDCASDAQSDFSSDCAENPQAYLMYVKGFMCNMAVNMQADGVQSRKAFFVRYCLATLCGILLSAVMLTGCSGNNDIHSTNDRIVWSYGNADERGELYTDDNLRLWFADFESMNTAMLCSKPNCTHTDRESCSAYGMHTLPVLLGDNLYFFDEDSEFNGDTMIDTSYIYKANPDGTGREIICTIDELSITRSRMLIVGSKAYFPMDKRHYNEDFVSTDADDIWLCSFDFSDNKFERIEKMSNIQEGINGAVWIYGSFNGNIIFDYSYLSEKSSMDLAEIEKNTKYLYKSYNPKTGEISDLQYPEPLFVGQGYYIYEKDGGVVSISEKGDEIFIPDFKTNRNVNIFNGKLFSPYGKMCADLSTGKKYSLQSDEKLVMYTNGSYILNNMITDEYFKLSEKEYIGGEL